MIELIDFFELFCHLEEISLTSGSKKHFRSSKMPSVRLELTTFRLWDWRANQLRQEGWESTPDSDYNIPLDSRLLVRSAISWFAPHGAPVWDPHLFLGFGIRPRYHSQAYDLGYLLISFIGWDNSIWSSYVTTKASWSMPKSRLFGF